MLWPFHPRIHKHSRICPISGRGPIVISSSNSHFTAEASSERRCITSLDSMPQPELPLLGINMLYMFVVIGGIHWGIHCNLYSSLNQTHPFIFSPLHIGVLKNSHFAGFCTEVEDSSGILGDLGNTDSFTTLSSDFNSSHRRHALHCLQRI